MTLQEINGKAPYCALATVMLDAITERNFILTKIDHNKSTDGIQLHISKLLSDMGTAPFSVQVTRLGDWEYSSLHNQVATLGMWWLQKADDLEDLLKLSHRTACKNRERVMNRKAQEAA